MNEDRAIVRKCLVFLLEMLANYDKKSSLFRQKALSLFSKETKYRRDYPSPAKNVNSKLVEFDLFHLNRLLQKKETIPLSVFDKTNKSGLKFMIGMNNLLTAGTGRCQSRQSGEGEISITDGLFRNVKKFCVASGNIYTCYYSRIRCGLSLKQIFTE